MAPQADFIPPQKRQWLFLSAWVVPAGEIVSVRSSGMLQKSQKPPAAPFWDLLRPLSKTAGNLEVLRPHPTKQRQDGAVITQLSPHRLGNRQGLLTSHRSIAHCAASPGRKEAAGQFWDWHPGVCLPTKASKPRPADASSSQEGRRKIITGA